MTALLVTLHGGNFVRGDASWDQAQTDLLRSFGFQVHQLDFPTTTLSQALAFLRDEVTRLKAQYPTLACHVLGRSSGGYLAKVLFDEGLVTRAAYLAPVFSPLVRATLVPVLGKESDTYFQNVRSIPATSRWTKDHELLLLATDDTNVPRECFTDEQLVAARYLGPRSHSDMVKLASQELGDCLAEFFYCRAK
jgi:hypothetical protein